MLTIKIYQINRDRDENRMAFVRHDLLEKFQGTSQINSSIYDNVWEGSIQGNSLEDIYVTFNINHPKDFHGHSLSVSDIIEVVSAPTVVGTINLTSGKSSVYTDRGEYEKAQKRLREKGVEFEANDCTGSNVPAIESGFYFCDSFGFTKVDFEPEKSRENSVPDPMRVLFLEPGKVARTVEISASLKDMHNLIGGYIEMLSPFNDGACIFCNRDRKEKELPLNRSIRDNYGGISDIIAGPCFICDSSGNKLSGLSDVLLNRYEKMFRLPEEFICIEGEYDSVTYDPEEKPSLSSQIESASNRMTENLSGDAKGKEAEPDR